MYASIKLTHNFNHWINSLDHLITHERERDVFPDILYDSVTCNSVTINTINSILLYQHQCKWHWTGMNEILHARNFSRFFHRQLKKLRLLLSINPLLSIGFQISNLDLIFIHYQLLMNHQGGEAEAVDETNHKSEFIQLTIPNFGLDWRLI